MKISRESPDNLICDNCLTRPAEHRLTLDNPRHDIPLCHFCFSALRRLVRVWKPTHLVSLEAILPKE